MYLCKCLLEFGDDACNSYTMVSYELCHVGWNLREKLRRKDPILPVRIIHQEMSVFFAALILQEI